MFDFEEDLPQIHGCGNRNIYRGGKGEEKFRFLLIDQVGKCIIYSTC